MSRNSLPSLDTAAHLVWTSYTSHPSSENPSVTSPAPTTPQGGIHVHGVGFNAIAAALTLSALANAESGTINELSQLTLERRKARKAAAPSECQIAVNTALDSATDMIDSEMPLSEPSVGLNMARSRTSQKRGRDANGRPISIPSVSRSIHATSSNRDTFAMHSPAPPSSSSSQRKQRGRNGRRRGAHLVELETGVAALRLGHHSLMNSVERSYEFSRRDMSMDVDVDLRREISR